MNKRKVAAIILASAISVNVSSGVKVFAEDNNKTLGEVSSSKSTGTTPVINGLKVQKALIDINYSKGVIINPKYIVIHDTDNRAKGANAMANRNYFANHPNANASAHYLVDDSNIVQALEDNWRGWHVGDGNHPLYNNSNSIGIELCVNSDNDFDKTVENGIELTKYLMKKYNIPAENVIRHYDVSGKICPKMMIQDRPGLWSYFKREIGSTAAEESELGKPQYVGEIFNVSSFLNVRETASPNSAVVSKLTSGSIVNIYGEENGFYKIGYLSNSQYKYGYVSKDYVKIDKLEIDKPSLDEDGSYKLGKVINVSSTLNVRKSASTSSEIVGTLKADEEVKILETLNGWYKISYGSSNGYVSSSYIKVLEEDKPGDTNTPEVPDEKPPVDEPNTPEYKTGKVVNVSSTLNIRKSPSTSSEIVGTLKADAEVKILETLNGWYKIVYGNTTGYVSSQYVQLVNNSTQVPTVPPSTTDYKTGKVVNVSSKLNVRSTASTSGSIIGYLSANQEVKIISTSNGWHKIVYGSTTGYVSSQYVQVVNNSTQEPTVPPSTTDYKTGKVINVSSTLNIRKSPSTSSEIVGTLKADAEVKILENLNGWYKIVYGNTTGYVSSQYISVVSSNTNSSQGSTNTTKTIGKVVGISTSLNVRQSPSTSASVLGYLLNNDEVEILSTSNGWHKILFRDNKIGYVSTKYIEVKTQRLIKETIVGDEKARVVNVTTNLTVLEGSDLNSQVIGYLLNNDDVIIKDEVKDFYKIQFKNNQDIKEGYVNRAYIELI